jgi:hypothetical protein
LLVIILPFIVGILEKLMFFSLNKRKKFQEIKIISSSILFAIISIIYLLITKDSFDFSFLKEPLIYFAIIVELIAFTAARFNYEKQNNYTVISFAQLSSLFLIFPITYFLDILFNINQEKVIMTFNNGIENTIFFGLYAIITLGYMYVSLKKGKIKYLLPLIIHAVCLPMAMYAFTRISNLYEPFMIYPILFILTSMVFLPKVIKNKHKYKKKYILSYEYIKSIFGYLFFYMTAFALSIFVAISMSTEFFTIFKRMGQLSSSVIIDYIDKKIKHSKIEILFIFLVFLITFILYIVKS